MSNENALTPIEQKLVTFYDDQITAVQVEGGEVYVPIRPICTLLGVDWNGQRRRINRDPVLSAESRTVDVTSTEGERRVTRKLVCLPLKYLNGWLFGMNPDRVKESVREPLIRYQRECYQVLSDAFLENKVTHRPSIDIDELLNQSDDPTAIAYRHAMAIANLAREQMLMKATFEAQAESISDLDRRVQILEANTGDSSRYITNSQAMQVSQAVRAVALELGKQTGGNEFGGVWGEVYRQFQVQSYLKLPAMRFEEVMSFLRQWWQSLTDEQNIPF